MKVGRRADVHWRFIESVEVEDFNTTSLLAKKNSIPNTHLLTLIELILIGFGLNDLFGRLHEIEIN